MNGNLILLHKVQQGPASQSHGLQVAKLAGIPNAVIKEAQNRLRILETQQKQQLNTAVQTDLFADVAPAEVVERIVEVEKESPALDALNNLDVDNLTPREALQQLYALKDLLKI